MPRTFIPAATDPERTSNPDAAFLDLRLWLPEEQATLLSTRTTWTTTDHG
ncbi:hypothetical protein [Plastoroseomonas arctica]|uniref:Uncharacterized protein n=1 Tax=Plastoroseomonas arctica TaxID=1509237 RepID=A0AAF1JVH8_9PROT|nr:hypothetical protein [Plastoroseomonas arctica]MBR0654595.1 hypothetical protein [Plastoroseomonas arctica]